LKRLGISGIRGDILIARRDYIRLQADLDSWIKEYNEARPHQGRWCFGKTPMQTFLDALTITREKMIAA
jgi:hypothetical protein